MKRNVFIICVLIVILLPALVLSGNQTEKEHGKLKGKKILMIIAARMFNETEFKEPKEIFELWGADVIIASSTLSEVTGGMGLRVKPDILFYDIRVKDFDAIFFVVGIGAGEYFNNYQANNIVKQAMDKKIIIAAICIAVRTLANSDILKGEKVAGSDSFIKTKGVIVTGKNVERDGNIITAKGPSASKEFGEAIVSALNE